MEKNSVKIEIKAMLENVSLVRVAISSFVSLLDVSIDELMDVKTAISEAVTNSIEHGYDEKSDASVFVNAYLYDDNNIKIEVIDFGIGIDDIDLAKTPTYTSKPESEHAGMGFTIMETFMDEILIDSTKNEGTKITLTKKFRKKKSS